VRGAIILLALFEAVCLLGEDRTYAPLPPKLIAAKTVFLQNDSGEQKFADHLYRQIHEWGRWRVVADKADADVIVKLDHKDTFVRNDFSLIVIDRQSGDALWTAKKDVGIGRWSAVAKALLSDLRKRLKD